MASESAKSKPNRQVKTKPGKSAELAQALIRSAGTGIYIVQDGKFQYVSLLFQELSGYTEQELLRAYPLDLIYPEDRQAVRENAIANLKGHRSLPYEYRFIKKNGDVIWVLERVSSTEYRGKRAAIGSFMDITERKRMEESRRLSEQNFCDSIENSPLGIRIVNEGGKTLYANRALLDIYGYSSVEELEAVPRKQRYTPESYEEHRERIRKRKRGEHVLPSYEISIVRSDGQVRYLSESRGEVLWNGEKQFQMVYQDVTERKKAEEKYQTIIRTTMDGFWLVDMQGHFLDVNDAYCHLVGCSRDELLNMAIPDLEAIEKPGETAKRIRKIKEVGYDRFESRHRRKDGEIVDVEISVNYLPTEGGRMFVFVRDITERKQMEEALRRSDERYRSLVDNAAEGITVVQDGIIKLANRKMAEITGYSVGEMNSMPTEKLIHPEDLDRVRRYHAQRMKGGKAPSIYPVRIIGKEGNLKWLERNVSTITWEGKPAGLVFDTDITQLKKAEEERKELEQKTQIASRLASVGEMAAGVAHEINNPLTAVIGYAQLFMDRKDIPFDIRRDLAAINEGAQRVAGIVRRLLTFSRQTKPERRHVDINELIESTLALRDYHLRINNIKVTTQLALDLPETVADPGQLQQVFLNLIVNAETEMKLAHGKGKLTMTTKKSHNMIKICVKDDGPGIKPEIMDRIFDPFFTTREVGQGTGLGLSLCYGIVAEHNGRIYAESEPGNGATFVVELPIVTEAEPSKPAEPVLEQPKKVGKAKILVVDDEPLIRDFVQRVLVGEGYEVDTVDNADDALKKIESQRYNLILLDIKMPGIDGMELYKRIQKIAESLAQRVVFITGDVMGADTEKFLSGAKVAHIDKPFNVEQLKQEVNRALTRGP